MRTLFLAPGTLSSLTILTATKGCDDPITKLSDGQSTVNLYAAPQCPSDTLQDKGLLSVTTQLFNNL